MISRPTKFEGALFDLDGVLVTTDQLIYEGINQYLVKRGLESLTPAEFGGFFGVHGEGTAGYVIKKYNLSEDVASVLAGLHENINYGQAKLKPGAKELLTYFKQVGIPAATPVSLSSKTRQHSGVSPRALAAVT